MGHSYYEVYITFGISKSNFRKLVSGKKRSNKTKPLSVYSEQDKSLLCEYIEEIVDCELPLTPTQLKIKAV